MWVYACVCVCVCFCFFIANAKSLSQANFYDVLHSLLLEPVGWGPKPDVCLGPPWTLADWMVKSAGGVFFQIVRLDGSRAVGGL